MVGCWRAMGYQYLMGADFQPCKQRKYWRCTTGIGVEQCECVSGHRMLHFKMSILLITCSPNVCCKLIRIGLGAHLPLCFLSGPHAGGPGYLWVCEYRTERQARHSIILCQWLSAEVMLTNTDCTLFFFWKFFTFSITWRLEKDRNEDKAGPGHIFYPQFYSFYFLSFHAVCFGHISCSVFWSHFPPPFLPDPGPLTF